MKVTIIGELGVNHDGDYQKALQMICTAKDAGVQIIKFQYYDPLRLLGKDSPYLAYATQCQFSKEQHERLKAFCDCIGMEFLVSVFDLADIPWADSLCKRHKVASRMNKDEQFISALLNTGKQVIISTQSPNPVPILGADYMYCITKYPTYVNDLQNLPCNAQLGLSSHCPDIQPTLRAISQGATIVEHHICVSRDEEGCDKSSSITFQELKTLNRFANDLQIV